MFKGKHLPIKNVRGNNPKKFTFSLSHTYKCKIYVNVHHLPAGHILKFYNLALWENNMCILRTSNDIYIIYENTS